MIIIDPVALGDVACARTSTKNVWDRTGTLVSVPANKLGATYDPSDLTKAPYALVEGAATNGLLYSQSFTQAAWTTYQLTVAPNATTAPDGTTTAAHLAVNGATEQSLKQAYSYTAGVQVTASVFLKAAEYSVMGAAVSSTLTTISGNATFDLVATTATCSGSVQNATIQAVGNGWFRCTWTFTPTVSLNTSNGWWINLASATSDGVSGMYVWGAQIETGSVATSYIATTSTAVTRAADVLAAGAGLVSSNIAITETAYSVGSTYAKDVQVYDPATYLMYQSLISANTGKALTDTTSWTPLNRSVNRWQMFDSYNNTQTTSTDEIIVVLSPQAISQGVYLGNVDANEVRISVVDLTEGLVYRETQSLVVSDSASSFYNWCFKRIRRKTYAVSVALPPYANALVTIALLKPGGIPKCGMCAVGPLVDVGLSQYGLSREIRDFSTINFNFDGTSNTQTRNFAKRMDIDVQIDNTAIDSVIEQLEGYRQKPVAWIGVKEFGSACVFGRYSSFKSVIQNFPLSQMNLQIEGTV